MGFLSEKRAEVYRSKPFLKLSHICYLKHGWQVLSSIKNMYVYIDFFTLIIIIPKFLAGAGISGKIPDFMGAVLIYLLKIWIIGRSDALRGNILIFIIFIHLAA